MASLARWVKGHFLYAMGTAIVLVIAGAFMAFKLDNKSGYIVFVAGLLFIVFIARVTGLI